MVGVAMLNITIIGISPQWFDMIFTKLGTMMHISPQNLT